ncbi:MAG: PilZ domain-containing protein [Myxococcota bacterium]|nr:PilZ domain-containing protein [Myxococcota bacterium]
MAETPDPVLIVDDGELNDVRDLLNELEVEYLEANGFSAPGLPEAVSLMITNGRHALAEQPKPRSEIHLVVYDSASRTVRKLLERAGCDLLLERPVSPHTMALVAAQALYAGPERRRAPRVVVSAPVKLQTRGRPRNATLVQLSLRGCGVVTDQDLKIGQEIKVLMQKNLTGGETLEASGPVLSLDAADNDLRQRRVSMSFRLMSGPSRRVVSAIMNEFGSSAEIRPRTATVQNPGPLPEPKPGERRSSPRKRFTRRILAAGDGTSHLLIGRDLSAGGMRVRPDNELALGDELKLAIHGLPGLPAVMVKAVVARDDGDDGMLLRFSGVPASIAARLEKIIDALPTMPVGKRPSSRPGVLVSEIIEHNK